LDQTRAQAAGDQPQIAGALERTLKSAGDHSF
jgi:hypothetical protein